MDSPETQQTVSSEPPQGEPLHEPAPVEEVSVAGHRLTVFAESPPLIAAMVNDIRAAQKLVWMEAYIFAGDAAGQAVADALADRASVGLDVRLMIDAIGSYSTPSALLARLSKAGVHVHVFHSFWSRMPGLSRLQGFNQRNHRKLLVIDDEIAYFGGMNVVDQRGIETVEDAKARQLPKSAGWRDIHVRLVGPQQGEIAMIMDRLWRRVHHQSRARWLRWPVRSMLEAEGDAMFFFDSQPRLKYSRPQRVFAPLIKRARREVTLTMAYFIPLGRVLRALVRAAGRGVRVSVIIPGQSDVSAVRYATRYFYHYLLRRRIRIYERNDQMLHSKAMVVDDQWTVIGSCNLDARSLRINLEFVAVIQSRPLAAAVQRICRHEMLHSTRVTWDAYRKRTLWQRLVDRLAWSFRRWL